MSLNLNQPPPPPDAPRQHVWPKYLLAAVILFFVVCVLAMVKEVRRVERIKESSQDLRPGYQQTNAPGGTNGLTKP